MNRPTVMPMAIWIMEAATLKTIALTLSIDAYETLATIHCATLAYIGPYAKACVNVVT